MKKNIRSSAFPPAQIYDREYVMKRVRWLGKKTKTNLHHITQFSEDPQNMKGNIENLIGVTQIPLGIAGPLKVNGQYAKGNFYIPLATTEGALALTYHRGIQILTKAGGVNAGIVRDEIHISPAFFTRDISEACNFTAWVKKHFLKIKVEAEKTTKHGKLLRIETNIFGRRVALTFIYDTADAQGMNMINKATESACKFIEKQTKTTFMLRSNLSSVKKVSTRNIHCGYGKSVFAEASIPKETLAIFNVTPEQMFEYYLSSLLTSAHAGMIGVNAHCANGITAIYIACGQDVADISTSHISMSICEPVNNTLYTSLIIPNLLLGTVGGGTGLGTQRECLELLGCYGKGKSKKFAEIVAAVALAGEIAVLAALINGTYVQAHEKHGRNKPKLKRFIKKS